MIQHRSRRPRTSVSLGMGLRGVTHGFPIPIPALLSFLAAASLLLTAGCSATRMSEKDEIRVGQEAAAQIENRYRTSEDPTVSHVGQRIAAASDKPNLRYRFRVVDQNELNAFSLPGGPVYVTDELLKAMGNDQDQLAGVLGHEVGHITKRHGVRQMERQNWFGSASKSSPPAMCRTSPPSPPTSSS